ncbi:eukaryotic translation initiation factor 3 subunit G-2 [Drosophila simulans]|uniref:Eukaryotic translation initiation factor 3 subunit G-2 n=2 Tax=melanogaster subgroup TaxID=32351 RepID=EI3G2_DROSI|nr:eukaryotic translation initiation factor 3 subunit G-2 [Drosophila simulans]XP_033165104.1 eukaryotic translation initiation factor 3 subunit G-2 [Drosophila mauritiana]B4QS37.1 RecName: Full=Eukaryotic translation initiation factor 3 subunit G-2; AltName: Full=Eukaryotic translation initiation factor 3 RNA-binding subunit 2; Short=eIF-3 RNA-binding subunit 2; AltName: Full=Eukaryotic translation initiation factor 3 subunit 4-2 [Drosophila simulans]EDX12233.1 GD19352 [Drosophila simulans]KMZ
MKSFITSWADEVDADYVDGLPPSNEYIKGDYKYVTEYKFNDDGKKVKVVRTFKIEKQIVPKAVARRRNWVKFGDSRSDKPGPNSQTTMASEEILMQFIGSKEFDQTHETQLDPGKNIAKCRICNGEHWSVNCPYKGTSMDSKTMMETKANAAAAAAISDPSKTGKYVPPFMKDGGGISGSKNWGRGRDRDDSSAVRISNLSESMTETDLEELVKKIGPHTKMYLAREKNSGLCKGFAYVHFKFRQDAAAAIEVLNGHGYDHLILCVEWSKPQP